MLPTFEVYMLVIKDLSVVAFATRFCFMRIFNSQADHFFLLICIGCHLTIHYICLPMKFGYFQVAYWQHILSCRMTKINITHNKKDAHFL